MTDRSQASKDALISSLIEMLETHGPRSISAREVAARAGVNHGLIHRHFGSREGLLRAAVERLTMDIFAAEPGQPVGMSAPTLRRLAANPHLAKLLARACLDGNDELVARAVPTPERLEQLIAPIRAGMRRMNLGDQIDPHVVNGAATAMLLGWIVFRPLLDAGFGLPDDADDQLERALAQIDGLLDLAATLDSGVVSG